MASQFDLFGKPNRAAANEPKFPSGFRYQAELITQEEEQVLVRRVRDLPFKEFEFHGYTGKRRVVSFGWKYDFSARELNKATDIPEFLLALRVTAANFARVVPESLQQVLVTEYRPGAGIGWHKDKAVFGEVIGVSLVASCVFRLRRRDGESWERVNVIAEPRSAYLLSGVARSAWEHSIPAVQALRYSITFRNLREDTLNST